MLIDPVDVGPIQYMRYAIVSYFHAPFDRVHLSATLNRFSFSTSEIGYWCTDKLISTGHFILNKGIMLISFMKCLIQSITFLERFNLTKSKTRIFLY